MSSRAAWRLESLGFTKVYRYTAGKVDWLANGLPSEGAKAGELKVGKLVRKDVPTCHMGEKIGEVARRVSSADWDVCPVVNAERIVLGMLWPDDLNSDPESTAEQRMQPGPQTIRPDTTPHDAQQYFRKREYVLVTTSDGELIGVLRHADVEEQEDK